MNTLRVGVGFVVVLMSRVATVGAATDAASATVSATIPLRAELELTRDANSVTRFTAEQVVFDRVDDQDGLPDGNPLFMYAPYRSETGKNWHLADIAANGASMELTADVTGTAGPKDLKDILDLFFGGFFGSDGSQKGGTSGDWEPVDSFSRILNEPFIGVAPLNYRLRLSGVPAGTYNGTVT